MKSKKPARQTLSLRKDDLKSLTVKSTLKAGPARTLMMDGGEVTHRHCGTGTYEPTC
jgi:hypothetical protein